MQITTTNTRITVKCEFHPDFPRRAKNLGGKWDANLKTWSFDLRDREHVLSLLRDIYGTDGTEPTSDLVTLRVTVPVGEFWRSPTCGSLFCAGRMVARAFGRDSGARLGDGVVLLQGVARSSGSRAKWYVEISHSRLSTEPAVVEIRDVPRASAMREIPELQREDLIAEIVGEELPPVGGDNIVKLRK